MNLTNYTKFLMRHPKVIIATTLLVSMVIAAGAARLTFSNDYQEFFSEENPQLVAFEKVQNVYSRSDNIFIMLVPDDGEVFSHNTMQAILEITDKSWSMPFVSRVDSLSNFQYSYGEEDDLVIEDLFSSPDADYQVLKQRALAEPLLLNRLISPAADATAINITLSPPGDNPMAETPLAVGAARDVIDQMKLTYPQIRFYESGVVMLDNAMAEATITDLSTLVPLTYVLVALGVALFLRSVWLSAATVALVFLSIAVAMGVAGWTGVVLTPPSASVPPIIMTLAVADCLHLLATLRQKRLSGLDVPASIVESVKINFKPIMLTSVTTAIGFMSLNFSDAPPFRDLGNMTAVGVLVAFLLSITFLPALLSLLPVTGKSGREVLAPRMMALAEFVIKRRRVLLVAGAGCLLVSLLVIPGNQLNDNFVEYFDESIKFRTDTDAVTDRLSGMYFVEYSLDSGQTDGISDPLFLSTVESFVQWLRGQHQVVHVDSIIEIVRRLNFNLHADDPAYFRLPDQREKIAQYLLLYEMSLPNGLDLNSQINVNKSSTRITVSLKTMSTSQMLEFERDADEWLARNAPLISAVGVSPSLMFSHISVRNIHSMLTGTVLALVLISLFLIIPLRSLKHGLLCLVSNMAPACIAFGVWALTIGKVSLGVSVVIAMTLGIVVDDTIHFISKYLHARREQRLSSQAAIEYAFGTVGVALVGTTVVLTGGFLVMAQSGFQVNSHMGALSALTIVIALLVDLLLIPPLLLWIDGHRSSTKPAPL